MHNVVQIYTLPIYEMMDTYFAKEGSHKWSTYSVLVRFITRTAYVALSTFLGALLPSFGDFVVVTGAVAAFPLEGGLVHHMYLKVCNSPASMRTLLEYNSSLSYSLCTDNGYLEHLLKQCSCLYLLTLIKRNLKPWGGH